MGFDAATASGTFGGGSSKSFSHTGAVGIDHASIPVSWVLFPSGTNTVSATYGGAATTQWQAASNILTSAGNGYVHSFYKTSPATGSQTVAITFSGGSNFGQGGALTYSGTNTSSPVANTAAATGSSSAPSVPISSTSGNFLFDALMANGATLTATLTQNWNNNDSGIRGASQRTASTGSSVSMAYTGTINQWALQAYEIAAAGGGGSTYDEPLTFSATASDALSAAATIVGNVSESGSASDSHAATCSVSAGLAETATASDSQAVAATIAATISESASATDSITAGNIFNDSLTFSTSASDALAAVASVAASVAESCSASDAIVTTATISANITESAAASDDLDVTGGTADVVTEVACALVIPFAPRLLVVKQANHAMSVAAAGRSLFIRRAA